MIIIDYGAETVDELIEKFNQYILDPTFENYGNFVIKSPNFPKNPELTEKYKTWTHFFGNFFDYSNAFNIFTDEPDIIERLTKAIRKNQNKNEYKKAKSEIEESERRLKEIRLKRLNDIIK